jgi:hypothetical protein
LDQLFQADMTESEVLKQPELKHENKGSKKRVARLAILARFKRWHSSSQVLTLSWIPQLVYRPKNAT